MSAQHSRRRDGALVISIALVLLLGAAGVATVVLRARDQRADAKARKALAATMIDVSAVGVASPTDHRVALVLSVKSDTNAKVVGASVDGVGWEAVHGKGVGLVTEVDCLTPPVAPSAAEAVLELHGQQRTFELLTMIDLSDVLTRTGKEACGDVDARRALALKASGTVRVPGGLQLALVVTNRSSHPVVLHDVTVGDLHVRTSKGLPISLAPHAAWRTVVVLDARGCGKPEPVVGLDISGQGGPAFVTVASADLPQLGLAIRKERCHR